LERKKEEGRRLSRRHRGTEEEGRRGVGRKEVKEVL
jgi:hypothetical protein